MERSSATPAPRPTPTAEPTTPSTPTPLALDAETQAFVERNGRAFSDYLAFNADENAHIARMEVTGEFDQTVRPIRNGDGVLLGNALLSLEAAYFDGQQVETVWVALIVDRGTDCIQRGTNPYPCDQFSVEKMLATYRDGDGPFDGWQAGDRIEFWLPADTAPTQTGAYDQLVRDYAAANQTAYGTFLSTGSPGIELLVPYRILMPCMKDVQQAQCYPERTP